MGSMFGAAPWAIVLGVVLVSAAIVAPLTVVVLRRDTSADRSNDNLYTAALRISGGALIFIGSFSAVSLWQADRDFTTRFLREFETVASLVQQSSVVDPVLGTQIADLAGDYIVAIRDDELAAENVGAQGDRDTERADAMLLEMAAAVDASSGSLSASERQVLDASVKSLATNRIERLAWRPAVPWAIVLPVTVIALTTLVLVGLYPAGRGRGPKIVQVVTSTAVVVAVLSMVIIVGSPSLGSSARGQLLTEFLDEAQ